MKGRMGLVENRPQVTKCLFVPPVTKRGGPAREVRRRQQRPALHRPESLLGLRDERLDVCLRSTKRGYERGDQLARESILRLLSLARQAGSFGGSRRGHTPIAVVHRGPCEVHQRLRERTEPDLLAEPIHRMSQKSRSC